VDRDDITRAFRTIMATGPDLAFATSADGTVIAWSGIGSGPALVHLLGVPFSNVEAEWRSPTLREAYPSWPTICGSSSSTEGVPDGPSATCRSLG